MNDMFPVEPAAPLSILRRLASTSDNALELGKAAEHLVVADLILQGRRCYLSDQGLPYDLVVDLAGYLIRVQCKASCFAKNVNAHGRTPRLAHSWSVRRRGKGGAKRLSNEDCEVVALVALDTRTIGYLPIEKCSQTMQIAVDGAPQYIGRKRTFCGTSEPLAAFTFDLAIRGLRR